MSLRTRLLGLILLATLLPALLMGWRFVRDSALEVNTAVSNLATVAGNVAGDLDHRIQGTAQLQFGLAHSDYLEASDRAGCSAYLSEVRETYPQYTGIISVMPDGALFCDSLRSGRQLDLRDRSYFKRASTGGNGLVLEPVFGRLTGIPVLQIVHPVVNGDGALRFMLIASLNLQALAQAHAKTLTKGQVLVMVDHRGTVMVSSDDVPSARKAGASMAGTALFGLATANAQGGVGELVEGNGLTRIWAVAPPATPRGTGLYVLVGESKQELLASSGHRLRQDLMILAAVSLLLFVGVLFLAEVGIRRQVGRITTMVRTLGDGDLGARVEGPYPRGELGGLMGALNSTAASLQRQREAIEELGLRLRQAQKLEALGTLAGGIAHDFNNILGAILGNLSLAHEEAAAGQPTQRSLEQIRCAALRARALVQNIQAFSRADAPALTVQGLQPIVEEVLALLRVSMPAGAQLRIELDPAPLSVRADVTQLHQVLLNLGTNAWQALQGKPGTVTVGLEAVDAGGDIAAAPGMEPGRQAHLWVTDTGCGIDAAKRERIFEPFFTTKGAQGGTGLGLSVVHGIVHGHGGSITVDSIPGQGSTFHLYLPLLAGDQPPPAPSPLLPDPSLTPTGRGQHILYVDDDEVMGMMVQRLLERAGYKVSYEASAQRALAAVGAAPSTYDLVVTDFNMPELSGLEVSRALLAIRADLPVVLISGYIFDELPGQAQRVGAREVIRKQHVLEDLRPAIARALRSADGGP